MSFTDYDEDLIGEAPCEFCGDLYPLCLLIEHQTTHLNEVDYFEEVVNQEVHIEPEIVREEKQQSPVKKKIEDEKKQQMLSPVKLTEEVVIPAQLSESPNQLNESKSAVIKEAIITQSLNTLNSAFDTKKSQFKNYHSEVEEFTTEKGEKLLVYGADIEPEENLESEKLQSCKTPNNPLLNTKEDVIDISSLSDDDGDESLEEFWRRARDFLKNKRGNM